MFKRKRIDHEADLRQLQDHARQAYQETTVAVEVRPAEYSVGGVPQEGHYNIRVPYTSCGPFTFGQAWDWINGLRVGVTTVTRLHAEAAGHQW